MRYTAILVLLFVSLTGSAQSVRGLFRVTGATTTPPSSTTATPPSSTAVAGSSYTITVTYASAPTSPTATFADLKYNKNLLLAMVHDDGSSNDYTYKHNVLTGGTASADGVTYPDRYSDDGTGRAIKWHWTMALNWNNGQITNSASTAGHLALWNTGLVDISNHSLTHVGYYDRYYDLKQNEKNIFTVFGYRPRTVTVPTAYEGFVENPLALGYRLTASAGYGQSGLSSDNNNETGRFNVIYTERVKASETRRLITTRRFLNDGWSDADKTAQQAFIDTMFTASNGGNANNKYFAQMFSHGPDPTQATQRTNYNWFINYIAGKANYDKMAMVGIQEFADYMHLKQTATRSQTISGNTQRIDVDYSGIDSETEWRDLSLLVSGGSITNVTVAGAQDYTYNATTGLVNIYNRKTTGYTDPDSEVKPPQLVGVTAYSSDLTKVYLTFDRPVSMTSAAGWQAWDSPYTSNPANRNPPNLGTQIAISSLTGSGTKWVAQLASPVSASTVIDYRIQQGNTVDASTSQKVVSYIGVPVYQASGSPATTGQQTLTVQVYGYSASTISINGSQVASWSVMPGWAQFVYPTGTVLSSVTATVSGKTVSLTPYPASATGSTYTNVTMDQDRILKFYANL